MKKALFTVRELKAETGLSHTKIYQLIRSGDLKAKKIGRRTVVSAVDLQKFIDALPDFDEVA